MFTAAPHHSLLPELRLQPDQHQSLIGACVCVRVRARVCSVAQSCLNLCDPVDCSLPDSSVHGISQERIWSGLPFPSPGDLPHPGIEPASLMSPAFASGFFTSEPHRKPDREWRCEHTWLAEKFIWIPYDVGGSLNKCFGQPDTFVELNPHHSLLKGLEEIFIAAEEVYSAKQPSHLILVLWLLL